MRSEVDRVPHIFRLGQDLSDYKVAPRIGPGDLLLAFPWAASLPRQISGRAFHLIPIQDIRNVAEAVPLNAQLIDPAHHRRRFLVDQPVVFILRVLPVAVDGGRRGGFPGLPLDPNSRLLLAAQIPEIPFAHDVDERRELAAGLVVAVDVVGDGDEVDIVLPEKDFSIKAGLEVVPPDPAHVLGKNDAYLSSLDVRRQPFPRRALEAAAGPAVIRIVDAVGKALLGGVVFQVFLLIYDGIAVPGDLIVAGEALVQRRDLSFSLICVHDALLSD